MAPQYLTDALLIKQYINGNEATLSILIERHQAKIYGFIYSKVQNNDIANDIFQEVFIKVIKTLKKNHYNEEGKFLPWVMRIAHNLIIDTFRKEKRMPLSRDTTDFSLISSLTDTLPNIETQLINTQIQNDLNRILQQLPLDQREVIEMRIYNDLSFKEIADLTGVSINTALGRMRYAIINIRKIIEKNNIYLPT